MKMEETMLMNPETGSVASESEWREDAAASQGGEMEWDFDSANLIEVTKTTTAAEREEWGEWKEAEV